MISPPPYTAWLTICGVSLYCVYKNYCWEHVEWSRRYINKAVSALFYVDFGCSIRGKFYCIFFYHLFSLRSNFSSVRTKSSCSDCSSGHGVAILGCAAFTTHEQQQQLLAAEYSMRGIFSWINMMLRGNWFLETEVHWWLRLICTAENTAEI